MRRSLGQLGIRSTMSYKRHPRLQRIERVIEFVVISLVLFGLIYAIVVQ